MGFCNAHEKEWRTTCPEGCTTEKGNTSEPKAARHIPFDPDLYNELNLERYELGKTVKILFNHPQGTHDDRLWAIALAIYACVQVEPPPLRPIAKTIRFHACARTHPHARYTINKKGRFRCY